MYLEKYVCLQGGLSAYGNNHERKETMRHGVKRWISFLLALIVLAGMTHAGALTVRAADDLYKIKVVVTSFDEDGNATPGVYGGEAYATPEYAYAGETVMIGVTPAPGYRLRSIEWGNGMADGVDITEEGEFTVWDRAEDIVVDVAVQKVGPKTPRRIKVVTGTKDIDGTFRTGELTGGWVTANADEAIPGQTVIITAVPYYGYTVEKIEWGNGALVGTDITGTGCFNMWDNIGDVVVDVIFRQTDAVKPAITMQPVRALVQEGSTAAFHVQAEGPLLSYRWQYKIKGSSTWRNCSSKTAGYNTPDLYVVGEMSRDGYQYRCVVTANTGQETISEPAELCVYPSSVTPRHVIVVVSARDVNNQYISEYSGYGLVDKEYALPGETVHVTAVPYNGFHVQRIRWGDGAVSGQDITDSGSFVMWDRDDEVVVDITMRKIGETEPRHVYPQVITVDYAGHDISEYVTGGTLTLSKTSAIPGETVKATAVPNDGFSLIDITWGDGYWAENGQFAMWDRAEDVYVKAFFQKMPDTPLKITQQPKKATVTEGIPAHFSVMAQGEGLHYRWQYKIAGTNTWRYCTSKMNGYKEPTLEVPGELSRNGYYYRCVVTDVVGNEVKSNAVLLTVKDMVLKITQQPQDQTVLEGETATFTVKATGKGITYKWQYKIEGTTSWHNCSSSTTGYNTDTLEIAGTLARNGFQYRCILKDENGKTATSAAATLTVNEILPEITGDPYDISVYEGDTACFYVTATGEGLTYLWQYRTAGSGTWRNCTSKTHGYNTPALEVVATLERDGFSYRCVVTDAKGHVVRSAAATLTITVEAVYILMNPDGAVVEEGGTAYFSVLAEGTGLTYQWQYKTAGSGTWRDCTSRPAGYRSPTLEVVGTAERNSFRYRCKVTDVYGNIAISNEAYLEVFTY